MKYVSKDEILKVLQKLIDARKNKTCQRQAIIEMKVFEYCRTIVEKLPEVEIEKD